MAKIPYTKPFLSYTAQLTLLKSRGMVFDSEEKALHLLENISYYRLSSYWHPLLAERGSPLFKPNTRFETVFALYKFDRELRKLLSAELEKVEVAVRSKMAYLLSVAHGAFWVENQLLFASASLYRATLAKIGEELSRSDNDVILSFKAIYTNPLPPSHMLLEVASFGTLLRLYNNLLSSRLKKDVSAAFGLSDSVFASWLHSLVSIRNACAHHERLWNRKLRIQPLHPRKPQHTWLTNESVSNARIYYVFSMLIYLLNTVNPKHRFKQKLESLFEKYPNADMSAMGFPTDWRSEPLWKIEC